MINQAVDIYCKTSLMHHSEIHVDGMPEYNNQEWLKPENVDPFELIDVKNPLDDIDKQLKDLFLKFDILYNEIIEFFLTNMSKVDIYVTVGRRCNIRGGEMHTPDVAAIFFALLTFKTKIKFHTNYEQAQCINWLIWQIMEHLDDKPEWWESFKQLPSRRRFYHNEYNEALEIMMQAGMHCIDSEKYPSPFEADEMNEVISQKEQA